MNGKIAKRIRKFVYGDELSHRARIYSIDQAGTVRADGRRWKYQSIKWLYNYDRQQALKILNA